MDLVQLETFLRVSQHGSFTAAAGILHVSQATVSARVKTLEAQLGIALFERNSHHVTPTAAGVQLVSYATEILSMASDARSAVRSRDIKPLVRLGSSPSTSSYIMPALLRKFAEAHPNITVLVEVDSVPTILTRIDEGKLDLALVEPCGTHGDISLTSLAADPVLIVAGAQTAFARIPAIASPEVIASLPFIMRCKNCCTLHFTSALIGKAIGRSAFELNVTMWVDELEMLKKLVLDGVGVTAISSVAMLAELMTGDFITIEVEGTPLVRQRALAMSAAGTQDPSVEHLRQFLLSDEVLEILASPESLLACPVPA